MRRLDLEVGGAPLEAVPELGLELGLVQREPARACGTQGP